MSQARRKLGRAASKSAKRLKPRPGKGQFITRAEARRRAERYVFNRMFRGVEVRDAATVRLGIYCCEDWGSGGVWVVYKRLPITGLRSSEVVLVGKRTGRVLYEGSAHDEG